MWIEVWLRQASVGKGDQSAWHTQLCVLVTALRDPILTVHLYPTVPSEDVRPALWSCLFWGIQQLAKGQELHNVVYINVISHVPAQAFRVSLLSGYTGDT